LYTRKRFKNSQNTKNWSFSPLFTMYIKFICWNFKYLFRRGFIWNDSSVDKWFKSKEKEISQLWPVKHWNWNVKLIIQAGLLLCYLWRACSGSGWTTLQGAWRSTTAGDSLSTATKNLSISPPYFNIVIYCLF
jgi:hypothetical protein